MAIFHQELGQVCTTMYLQGSAADNTVCKMHANDTVAACAAGNDFIGVVVGKRDGLACVQVAGFGDAALHRHDGPDRGRVRAGGRRQGRRGRDGECEKSTASSAWTPPRRPSASICESERRNEHGI